MKDPRLESAQIVLQECFWGDYELSAEEMLDKLDNSDPGFDRFLFSKIIENSRHPSRHLRRLFEQEHLHRLLQHYRQLSGDSKRARLVAANLTGKYELAPEYG